MREIIEPGKNRDNARAAVTEGVSGEYAAERVEYLVGRIEEPAEALQCEGDAIFLAKVFEFPLGDGG